MSVFPARHLLVVDDDPEFRALVRTLLAGSEYSVSEAADGDAALRLLERQPFDVIVIDMVMPEREGLETVEAVRQRYPECRIVATSGAGQGSVYLQVACRLGAAAILAKPIDRERLHFALGQPAPAAPSADPRRHNAWLEGGASSTD
jgi:CheY-like chemotaxis protein